MESVEAGGRESLFLSDPQCCHFSLSPHSLLLQLLPCYFFLIPPPSETCDHLPLLPARPLRNPAGLDNPHAHHPAQLSTGPSSARCPGWRPARMHHPQQGRQVSLLPPQGSFIVTINGRKQNGHHDLQYRLDLSEFSWDGDTAWQTADLNRSFWPGNRLQPAQERLGRQTQLWGLSHLHRVPQLLWLPLPN